MHRFQRLIQNIPDENAGFAARGKQALDSMQVGNQLGKSRRCMQCFYRLDQHAQAL